MPIDFNKNAVICKGCQNINFHGEWFKSYSCTPINPEAFSRLSHYDSKYDSREHLSVSHPAQPCLD